MTRAQKRELRRLTRNMWELLRYARRAHPWARRIAAELRAAGAVAKAVAGS